MMTLNNKKRKKPPKRATFYFSIKSIVNTYILIVGDYASMAYTKAGARATAKYKTKRLETVKACQALSSPVKPCHMLGSILRSSLMMKD